MKYFVYLMSRETRTLYIGVTNNIERRLYEPKSKQTPGFTSKYNITRLGYFEEYGSVSDAISREKQLKGWTRAKKIALIQTQNLK